MRYDIKPLTDAIDHTREGDPECICGPDVVFGNGGVVVRHHPLVRPQDPEAYNANADRAVAEALRELERAASK